MISSMSSVSVHRNLRVVASDQISDLGYDHFPSSAFLIDDPYP